MNSPFTFRHTESGENKIISHCHPEPFAALEDKLREEDPTLCHPECNEGSRRWRFCSNVSVAYAPATLRFFAPLRSTQNDKLGRSARNDRQSLPSCYPFVSFRAWPEPVEGAGSKPFVVLEDRLREGDPTVCHPEPFAALEDRLGEGPQCH